jgi:uncharacterized membrane protein
VTFRNVVEKFRLPATIVLGLAGIGAMVLYATCDTSCSSLTGDVFGIDLKFVGPAFMVAILILAFLKQNDLIRIMLAAGIGVEIFLFAFQVREDVFCQYCLAFAVIVIALFALYYNGPHRERRMPRRLLFLLGSADIPFLGIRDLPLILFVVLGYIAITVAFNGGVIPTYGA